ncbi:hypothetical protein E2562_017651 [Oryza meyeriana var. granulata]|uniref:60S ribosomal protein L35 n=1 Tax=Oryza meyeriana var. granulata TaxID=110450 RepID=A0A6G1BZ61_9ORYZ|nr:hypothetical protein E2562_017651 [Oryza meyeriana var. granulata]
MTLCRPPDAPPQVGVPLAGEGGARELARDARASTPDNPMNSVVGGLASGAVLGRIQGGHFGAVKYAVTFAAAGTTLDYAARKLSPQWHALKEQFSGDKDWFRLPEWSPIQVLDEEALAKKRAREEKLFAQRALARIKVHELRGKNKAELQAQLKDLKAELSLLRVAKVTGGAPNKLSKIKVVRTSIARVLTVISQKQKAALREAYKKKSLLPLDLRPKKTRAIRRRLTKHQLSLKTEREKKREKYFPMRNGHQGSPYYGDDGRERVWLGEEDGQVLAGREAGEAIELELCDVGAERRGGCHIRCHLPRRRVGDDGRERAWLGEEDSRSWRGTKPERQSSWSSATSVPSTATAATSAAISHGARAVAGTQSSVHATATAAGGGLTRARDGRRREEDGGKLTTNSLVQYSGASSHGRLKCTPTASSPGALLLSDILWDKDPMQQLQL